MAGGGGESSDRIFFANFSEKVQYAVHLKLTPQARQCLKDAHSQGLKTTLRFGAGDGGLTIGERTFPVTANKEEQLVDVLQVTKPGVSPLVIHKGRVYNKLFVQRVLDDTERQRARARGMVADRKERTLIALDGRPSSSGPKPKQTVTRTLATPPLALSQDARATFVQRPTSTHAGPSAPSRGSCPPFQTARVGFTPPPGGARAITPPPHQLGMGKASDGTATQASPRPGVRAGTPPTALLKKSKPPKFGKGGNKASQTAGSVAQVHASDTAVEGARQSLQKCLIGILMERPFKQHTIEKVLLDVAARVKGFQIPSKPAFLRALKEVAEFKSPAQWELIPYYRKEAQALAQQVADRAAGNRPSSAATPSKDPPGSSPLAPAPVDGPPSIDAQEGRDAEDWDHDMPTQDAEVQALPPKFSSSPSLDRTSGDSMKQHPGMDLPPRFSSSPSPADSSGGGQHQRGTLWDWADDTCDDNRALPAQEDVTPSEEDCAPEPTMSPSPRSQSAQALDERGLTKEASYDTGTEEVLSTSSEDSSWYSEIATRSPVAIDAIASDEEYYARAAEYQEKLAVYKRLRQEIEDVRMEVQRVTMEYDEDESPRKQQKWKPVVHRLTKQTAFAQKKDAAFRVLHAELKVMKDEVMEYQRHAYATRPSHPMDED